MNIFHSLKNSKCEGFDGLCISPIKDSIDLVPAPLTHICNLSFSEGVVYTSIPSVIKSLRLHEFYLNRDDTYLRSL